MGALLALLAIVAMVSFFSARGGKQKLRELADKIDSLELAIRQLTETLAAATPETAKKPPVPEPGVYSIPKAHSTPEASVAPETKPVFDAKPVPEAAPPPEAGFAPETKPQYAAFTAPAAERLASPAFARDFPAPKKAEPVAESLIPPPATESFATEEALFSFSEGEAEEREELSRPPAREPLSSGYIRLVANFIRGGNIWVTGGVIMLLLGFAFLAQLGVFPIELRLALAAFSGMGMVAGGLYLRLKRPMYALILQGGGIGILYLSAFASAKLTTYLPPAAALIVMTGLIIPAVALAILQNAQALALVGFLGGFAAPILLSDGSGNYVALFTCYLLLNLGILAITRFRLWRWLNFAGAFCSFVVMGYWGVTSYDVTKFSSVEPFLLAFTIIYIGVTLVSARKREFSYSEPLDMILACAVPFTAAIFQWRLAVDIPHGLSVSAVAFGAFFIVLAGLVWKLWGETYRRLAEFYLANGVVLANLAIPLELSGNVTATIWAVEGAILFFFACRIRSARIKAVALALQIVGMGALTWEMAASGGRTHTLLSTSIVSLALLASACFHKLDADAPGREKPEALNAWLGDIALERVLAIIGLFWWYFGMFYESYKFFTPLWIPLLGGVAVTSALAYAAKRLTGLRELRLAMIHAPLAAACVYLTASIGLDAFARPSGVGHLLRHNFLYGWGAAAWAAFATTQGALLYLSRAKEKPRFHAWWAGIFALELLLVLTSSGRGTALDLGLAPSWGSLASILPALAYTAVLVWVLRKFMEGKGGAFTPDHARVLGGNVPAALFALLMCWLVPSFFDRGDPAPLPLYIPFLNPLELQQALCIAIFALWQRTVLDVKEIRLSLPAPTLLLLIDGLAFAWLHSMLFRAISFWAGTPMTRAWEHETFQVLLTALWGVWGMAHLVLGHRKGFRLVWAIGAALMLANTAKLFLVDLADKGTLFRVISFFVMGGIFLLIGWLAPLPPAGGKGEKKAAPGGSGESGKRGEFDKRRESGKAGETANNGEIGGRFGFAEEKPEDQ